LGNPDVIDILRELSQEPAMHHGCMRYNMSSKFPAFLLHLGLFISIWIGSGEHRPVQAQKNEAGKEIAKGLLRGLIESQLERQGRETYGPGRPVPPIVGQIPQPAQPTPEMQQVRRTLTTLNQEAATLPASLMEESKRIPELRPLVADVISFQATVAAVKQRADRDNNHLSIQPGVQSIDQTWKPLAHQLASVRTLSKTSRENVDRIDKLNAQICRILGIRDQFNSRELVRAADLLAADLGTLTDEISYSVSGGANKNRLVGRVRRLQEQAVLFANLASSGAQFSAVVGEYQNLYQSWQTLRSELDPISTRSATQAIARIQSTHRTIHQLLRLEFGFDQILVQRMTEGLDREITDLYRTITLEQLLLLPDSRSLPAAADAFSGTAQNLLDVVVRREPMQTVGEAWLYLDEQWQLFEYYLKPIRTPETSRRLEGLAQSIDSLKNAIGVSVAFDRRAVLQQAASVATLAEHLQGTVRRWLNRPGQQNVALATEVQLLNDRCRELEAMAGTRRDQAGLASRCDIVIRDWQLLRPKLSLCRTEEQETIEQTIDSFIPAMIRLRTMLEN
jgi:hypothetical protein